MNCTRKMRYSIAAGRTHPSLRAARDPDRSSRVRSCASQGGITLFDCREVLETADNS